MKPSSRNKLPEEYKNASRKRQNAPSSETKLPNWIVDMRPSAIAIRERVARVFKMYLERHTLEEIMDAEDIAYTTIYRDIAKARELQAWFFQKELANILLEQVEARKLVIREARKTLEDLRAGVLVVDEDGKLIASGEDASDGDSSITRIVLPNHARAVATLLEVITTNEKGIEELVGLRNRKTSIETDKEEIRSGGTLVIRTRQRSVTESIEGSEVIDSEDIVLALEDEAV